MVSLRAFLAMTGVMAFVLLFGAVAIQSQRISGQSEIDRLAADLGEAEDLHHALRAQIAERESPERITAEAEQLNMIEPGPVVPLTPGALASSKTVEGQDAVGIPSESAVR
ncbi:MAG: hypothetical protein WD029_04210 [Microthrixaceae bacterium]